MLILSIALHTSPTHTSPLPTLTHPSLHSLTLTFFTRSISFKLLCQLSLPHKHPESNFLAFQTHLLWEFIICPFPKVQLKKPLPWLCSCGVNFWSWHWPLSCLCAFSPPSYPWVLWGVWMCSPSLPPTFQMIQMKGSKKCFWFGWILA